ncbi:MAG TPA: class I SAM-dependent methyltransferase [bacterium]|nr:class I SAM-dependent methyltransferase [bacterium]
MKADRTKWEARYRAGSRPHDGPPSGLLRRWLPKATFPIPMALRRGRPPAVPDRRLRSRTAPPRALDVATGLGRNALHLARAGYHVDAVDISPTALREAARRARREGLRGIRWIAADLDRWHPERGQYDVVVNAFFLNRRLFPALRAAVRPGGILIFETHLVADEADGPAGPKYRLRPGELRRVLRGWDVLYAKDGLCRAGRRMLALGRIVARRPTLGLRRQPKRAGNHEIKADRQAARPP